MAQLDIFGLPCPDNVTGKSKKPVTCGPAQGLLLLDQEQTLAQARTRGRVERAFTHLAAGINLLYSAELQQWRLPPLTLDELEASLRKLDGLETSLQRIRELLEDAMLAIYANETDKETETP